MKPLCCDKGLSPDHGIERTLSTGTTLVRSLEHARPVDISFDRYSITVIRTRTYVRFADELSVTKIIHDGFPRQSEDLTSASNIIEMNRDDRDACSGHRNAFL